MLLACGGGNSVIHWNPEKAHVPQEVRLKGEASFLRGGPGGRE